MALTKVTYSMIEGAPISLADYGADLTGATDSSVAIQNWLAAIVSSGQNGFVPAGTYLITSPITFTVTGNISIEADRNAIFKGSAAVNEIMILFTAATRDIYSVSWSGGVFDTSLTPYTPGALSGTGLGIQKLWKCVIQNVTFTGPADYTVSNGDTGLDIVDCKFVTVSNCIFTGHPDLGIYITGDSDLSAIGDGGDIVVEGCHFIKCGGGVGIKRQTQRVIVDSNTFKNCYRGVTIVATDVVLPDPPAGRRCIISNNSFAYTAKAGVQIQTGSASVIVGNRIQDIGYALDGTTPVANSQGIIFEGVSNCLVNDNWIGYQDWTATGTAVGVLLQDFVWDATTLDCEYNAFSTNYLQDLDIGFRETPGEADYNSYQCNTLVNVPDTYNNIQANSTVFDQNSGTWTVTLHDAATGGNASPTTATGNYIKTGKLVFATFTINNIDTTGMTAGDILYISLPFAATYGATGAIVLDSFTFPASKTSACLAISNGASRALISGIQSGATDSAFTVASISTGVSDIVQASIVYSV